MRLYMDDMNSTTMKAYIDFLAKYGKTYSDLQSTADRYKHFKHNYEKIQKHNENEDMLPFSMEINAFVDRSVDEFMEGHKLRVPHHLMQTTEEGEVKKIHMHKHQKGRKVGVPMFDSPKDGVPAERNWFKEGIVTAPAN